MSWSKIPKLKGLDAARHWLSKLEREQHVREKLGKSAKRLEAALAADSAMVAECRDGFETARWLGRVDGLREGLSLYRHGLLFEQRCKDLPAFRVAVNYAYKNPDNDSAEEICGYLDRQIQNLKQRGDPQDKDKPVPKPQIGPPKSWYEKEEAEEQRADKEPAISWADALVRFRNNVDVFCSGVRRMAYSEEYALLQAWATWGDGDGRHPAQQKAKKGPPKLEK